MAVQDAAEHGLFDERRHHRGQENNKDAVFPAAEDERLDDRMGRAGLRPGRPAPDCDLDMLRRRHLCAI
jgi:hypothetical protein